MTWTFTSLVIQIIAGLIGGHVAAVAVHEHAFGAVGHTVAGLVGGFLSGYFLQTLAITTSKFRRPASFSMRSRPGRWVRSLVPLIPASVKTSTTLPPSPTMNVRRFIE